MSRGERLHHEKRKKTKYRKILAGQFVIPRRIGENKYTPTDKEVGRMAHTPQLCSCSMCGNPRRRPWNKGKGKLTMQERKQIEAEDD